MPGSHGALVGATAADVRDVMVRALLSPWNGGALLEVPVYEPSKRLVTWKNGSTATCYSADEPERLRGPQHHWAWPDEIGSWRYEDAWDQLQFGLRLGVRAQACVTGTPRATELVKRILKLPSTVVTRGSTFDNANNLDAASVAEMKARYGGTRLGRQELLGELLEDVVGALWTLKMIDDTRVQTHPDLVRVVVGVDPSGKSEDGDEQGIVVAGKGTDGHLYTLADRSTHGTPDAWGRRVVQAFVDFKADRIVGERNYGGDMVRHVIETAARQMDVKVSYEDAQATRGKVVRAEPVSALYEQGRAHHVGEFPQLEEQMREYVPENGVSPDRMDALVWAATNLMIGEPTAGFGTAAFKSIRRAF